MPEPTEDLMQLSTEVKKISKDIAGLKSRARKMEDSPERQQLIKDIKTLQYQALFYIEKMENLSKNSKE